MGGVAPNSSRSLAERTLSAQIAWAIASALWNGAGAYLIANGQKPLGPSASISSAVILLAMAVLFWVSARRRPVVYLLLSIVTALLGLYAVTNAFTADPTLWPSDSWRYGGVAINSVAVVCGVLAVADFVGRRG